MSDDDDCLVAFQLWHLYFTKWLFELRVNFRVCVVICLL